MKATVLHEHGGPEKLSYEETADPEVKPCEVLVKVKAVALNHLDIWVRNGLPHLKISYPHILGSDIAGIVETSGPGVDDVPKGTKVLLQPAKSCGHCQACLEGRDNFCRHYAILGENTTGGYAEFISVPRSGIMPYPEHLDFEDAACLPLTFQTAWQMVAKRARLEPGETVLLNGAGSGVTLAAVQIVKLMGGVAIVTSTSDEKLEKIREFGADHLINSKKSRISKEVKQMTGGRGVDVVVDHVGSALWAESMKALSWGGRLVTCGATSGPEIKIDLRQIFFKQVGILGSTMGSKGDLMEVMKHVGAKRLRPVKDRTFALKEAGDAHRRLEKGDQFGKIVLVP